MNKDSFEKQKADAIRQWAYIKANIHADPWEPIHSWKIEAIAYLKIKHGWKYNCFLCSIFNKNSCKGCPLVSCFYDEEEDEEYNDAPYEHLEWCQDHGEPVEKMIKDIDLIIDAISNLKYEEVPHGTLNDSDLTR